jgi:glycogen(starch) synthase
MVPGLGSAPFAVVVARIDRGKGQDVAIEAFARAAIPDLHLVLAGAATDPAFAAELRAQAVAVGPRVHLIGGVEPRTARALLAEATVVLIPSRAEPFGIVLLEAWAEGAPALFADIDGLSDIAREAGATFGAVSGHAAGTWAERLRAALNDDRGLEQERRLGPDRVGRRYSWRALAERTAAAYQRALS